MKYRRIAVLVLCAVLLLGVCAGCGTESLADVVALYNDGSDSVYDYVKAKKAYDNDEIMGTVNGLDITWEELFCWIRHYVDDYCETADDTGDDSQGKKPLDWNATFEDGSSYEKGLLGLAFKRVVYMKVVESKAAEMGISLDEEDELAMQSTWESAVKSVGSVDEARAILSSNSLSYDLYMYQLSIDCLSGKCCDALYGENGENLEMPEILDYANSKEYMMIKMILIKDSDEEGTKLEQDELDKKYARAEEIKAKLDAYTGDDIEEYFDKLMEEYSEDINREGYLFQKEFMISEVSEAAQNLKEKSTAILLIQKTDIILFCVSRSIRIWNRIRILAGVLA